MKAFRETQGFTVAERADLRKVFDGFDREGDGEVDTVELGNMLRFLGYAPTFDHCRALGEQVDRDSTGEISFVEFLMAVRAYEEAEMETFQEAFDEFDEE